MNLLLIILITIILSAFFSGMEIAFVSANKLRLELDKKSGPVFSGVLSFVTKSPGKFIATMLIGNNIALVIYGIAFAGVLEPSLVKFTDSESVILIIQTIISTLIILVLAEFLPKALFRIFPNTILNIFSVPLAFFYMLFYPITSFAMGITNVLLKKVIKNKAEEGLSNPVFSRVDLDHFINESQIDGRIDEKAEEEHEVKLFRNALDFSKVRLREIMVPRTEMEVLDINSGIDDLKAIFIETGYSRILIFENNIDNIIGYVHSSIIFEDPGSIRPHLKSVLIAPETMPANKLLSIFIQEHRNIAVVVDEFGGTAGMVTSEDILEEIFGEIEDEHDTSDYIERKLNDSEYVFSGRFEIDLLNEKYNLKLPENEDFETLAGFILAYYKSIPKINTVIEIDHFKFKILKATNTKIELVHLTIKES
ncbi:MAG: HlyC/CorC family transporter [Prolixibacteraceae bacterium]|nr:HlyC/CorC family transporter [Prolixibacteraceae bacterium]MBN2773066.1 HlyC/CorC family transporter [Prolixibacteraceae bacterium]